jgi:hypothetical protein
MPVLIRRTQPVGETDLTLPDFLNRKLNPVNPASMDERAEFAKTWTATVETGVRRRTTDEEALRAIEEAEAADRKAKAKLRIDKMLARKNAKGSHKDIPDEYLSWDAKKLRFYDVRVRAANKLTAKRAELELPPLTEAETKASVVRCLGLKSWK